jgi:heterodisulfide reductase subunit C
MTDTRSGLPAATARASQVEYPTCPRRGPLRAVILAATGQDVRLCANCASCESLIAPGMDLGLGEMVRAAARNDSSVLTCASLWACEDLLLRPIPCQAGLSIPAIVIALQREAELRGLAPDSVDASR